MNILSKNNAGYALISSVTDDENICSYSLSATPWGGSVVTGARWDLYCLFKKLSSLCVFLLIITRSNLKFSLFHIM